MRTRKLMFYVPAIAIAAILTITACNKNNSDDTTPKENIGYGAEEAQMAQYFSDVESIMTQAMTTGSVLLKGESNPLGDCVSVSIDTAKKMAVVSFAPANSTTSCIGKDGRFRKGSIKMQYTGKYGDSNSVQLITFSDYYVNDYQLDGTITLTYRGRNMQKLPYWSSEQDVSMMSPDRIKTQRRASCVRTLTGGESTQGVAKDDEYSIVLTYGVLTRADGSLYKLKTNQPMLYSLSCSWIRQGVVEITPATDNGIARRLDYGNGGCDDQAVLTVNTVNTTLKMN